LQTSKLILDFEFDQHLESHKHVISLIMGFRDTGCYIYKAVLLTIKVATRDASRGVTQKTHATQPSSPRAKQSTA
jgi:hypothetical protein